MTDVVIGGGGLAGLSLALRLAERGVRVVVLEARPRYTHDRTWCFWDHETHAFSPLVSHAWPRWRVRTDDADVTREAPPLLYQRIPSAAFYDHALARIAESPLITLRLGEPVGAVHPSTNAVVVETPAGPVTAPWFVDTRPREPVHAPHEPALLQHFVGWEIRTDAPLFDPTTVTLMDFRVAGQGAIHFVYTLPLSPTRALVEDTYFSPMGGGSNPFDLERHRANLRAFLAREGVAPYAILHEETGALPMTTAAAATRGGRVLRAGIGAGALRPATGYGFQSIQRQVSALAEALAGSPDPDALTLPPLRPWWVTHLDRIFLTHLATVPEAGPALFRDLFENAAPAQVAAFLSDGARPEDALAVMRALPTFPLSTAAVRTYARRAMAASPFGAP